MDKSDSKSKRSQRSRWVAASLLLVGLGLAPFWYTNSLLKKAGQRIRSLRLTEARELLQSASKTRLYSGHIAFMRARIARHDGQTKDLNHQLNRARELGFPAERVQREETLMLASNGQAASLIDELTRMLQNDYGDGGEYISAFVQGFTSLGQLDNAKKLLSQWESGATNDARLYFHQGNIHFLEGMFLDANESYRKALDLDPKLLKARLSYARRLRTCKEFDEAEKQFRIILSDQPSHGNAKLGLALTLIELGKQEIGTQHLQDLLAATDVCNYDVRMALSRIQVESDRAGHAKETLAPLLKDFRDDVDLNFQMLQIAIALADEDTQNNFAERHKKLTEIATRAHEIADKAASLSAEETLANAMTLLNVRWRAAKLPLEIALSKAPQNPAICDALARFHAKAANLNQANHFRDAARTLRRNNRFGQAAGS